MVRYKYTPEALAEAAANSHSITGVMRALGVRISGGSHAHISRQLKRFGIDTSHFSRTHNKGHSGARRTTSSQLLVRLPAGSRRTPGTGLKWALDDIGVPEECEECGVGSSWRGRPLTLHVDHVNGDFLDNRPPNLRMLCPNCHSQTDTYAGRNRSSPSSTDQPPPAVTPTPRTPHGALPLKEAEEVVRRVEAGLLGPSEAARQIGCHRNHVARLRRRLATRGTLLTARDASRATRTAARDEIVIRHALANPGLGPRKLAELVKASSAGECAVSHGTVSAILRRAGLHTASARRTRLIESAGVAK